MAPTDEENALAELLAELKYGDFARILNQLSPQAKDELRSAIAFLQSKASFGTHPNRDRNKMRITISQATANYNG